MSREFSPHTDEPGEPGDKGVVDNKLRKQLNIENAKLSKNLSIHFIFKNVKQNKRR